jgi:AcrR family transcriptional regulator
MNPAVAARPEADANRSLRDEHLTATRDRIARAAMRVLTGEHPTAFSVPAVAEEAGVSVRTVYRHFPTKEALADAAANAGSERASRLFPPGSRQVANVGEWLPPSWVELWENRELIEVQHRTPAGRALRRARMHERRAPVRDALVAAGVALRDDDLDRLTDLVVVLVGSAPLLDLAGVLDQEPDDAGRLVAFALDAVVDRARTTKEIP